MLLYFDTYGSREIVCRRSRQRARNSYVKLIYFALPMKKLGETGGRETNLLRKKASRWARGLHAEGEVAKRGYRCRRLRCSILLALPGRRQWQRRIWGFCECSGRWCRSAKGAADTCGFLENGGNRTNWWFVFFGGTFSRSSKVRYRMEKRCAQRKRAR